MLSHATPHNIVCDTCVHSSPTIGLRCPWDGTCPSSNDVPEDCRPEVEPHSTVTIMIWGGNGGGLQGVISCPSSIHSVVIELTPLGSGSTVLGPLEKILRLRQTHRSSEQDVSRLNLSQQPIGNWPCVINRPVLQGGRPELHRIGWAHFRRMRYSWLFFFGTYVQAPSSVLHTSASPAWRDTSSHQFSELQYKGAPVKVLSSAKRNCSLPFSCFQLRINTDLPMRTSMTTKGLFWKPQYHMLRNQDPRSSLDPGNYVLQVRNHATKLRRSYARHHFAPVTQRWNALATTSNRMETSQGVTLLN
jgi:hypothetical protein